KDMNEQEKLWRTVASLADTMEKTRCELDGIRAVFIGVLGALSTDAQTRELLGHAIAATIDADRATLSEALPGSALQQREDWARLLMPADLWQRVQQIRGL